MERSILALLKLQKILAIFASPNRYFTKNVKCLGTSRVVYKDSCWDCQDFYYTDKTKQRLDDRKTEHFKYETSACIAGGILLPGVLFRRRSGHTRRAVKPHWNTHLNTHSSHGSAAKTIQHSHANPASYACRLLRVAITPLLLPTMSRHKWDHFEILAKKMVSHPLQDKGDWLLIRDLQPPLNENVSGEELYLFCLHAFSFICKFFYFMLSFASLISCLSYIFQISVVIQRLNILVKMYVGTYETSS